MSGFSNLDSFRDGRQVTDTKSNIVRLLPTIELDMWIDMYEQTDIRS